MYTEGIRPKQCDGTKRYKGHNEDEPRWHGAITRLSRDAAAARAGGHPSLSLRFEDLAFRPRLVTQRLHAWLPKLGYRSHDTVPKNEHTTFVNIITKDMVKDGYLRSRKKQGSGETEFVLGARSLHTKDANAEKEFVQGRVMEQAGASQVTQSQA